MTTGRLLARACGKSGEASPPPATAALVLLLAAVVLLITTPVFAGHCRTGVRVPRSVVVGYRKRADALTLAEAAARAGVRESVIRAELRSGRLKGVRVGGRWFVDPIDLERWDAARTKKVQSAAETAPAHIDQNPGISRTMERNSAGKSGAEKATFRPVSAAVTEQDPEFLTMKEATRLARSSPNAIYDWIQEGLLGDYGTPGKRLIRTVELRRLLGQGPTKPPPPK